MCGIAAFCGNDEALKFIKHALPRLEYRGYDSWGYSLLDNGNISGVKGLGSATEGFKGIYSSKAKIGIGHTRWATHGKPSLDNCHPISDQYETVYIVHNGIIDNYQELKKGIVSKYNFKTDTDTEVISNLFNEINSGYDLESTLIEMKKILKGEYSFIGICKYYPTKLFFISNGSPLCFTEEGYVASDPIAFQGISKQCWRLLKGECGVISRTIYNLPDIHIFTEINDDTWSGRDQDLINIEDEIKVEEQTGHFMLKEIKETPEVLSKGQSLSVNHLLSKYTNVVLFGCGSSYNAALYARSWFESAKLLTHIEYSSEFLNRPLDLYPEKTLFIGITQSGETKDTLMMAEKIIMKRGNSSLLIVSNNITSSAYKLSKNNIFLNCGSEFGVAATKTFTSTCIGLIKLARKLSDYENNVWLGDTITQLCDIDFPNDIQKFLLDDKMINRIKHISSNLVHYNHMLFLGRGANYPIAREGALKLKEVSGIHCEAIPAAEMKHGPIALINRNTMSVFVASHDGSKQEKVLANAHEIHARGGKILLVTDISDWKDFNDISDYVITVPYIQESIQPLMANVALQLLAYETAVGKGLNPDRPIGLAKCVTVE